MPKLHKKVTIARSGVYVYSPERLPGLGLSLPPEKKGQASFRVFRPPEVVARSKDKFVQLPLTLLHPSTFVDGNTFRDYVVGYTGDTVEARTEKNVVYLDSTVTIFDNEALNAYWRGIREVSPGYRGIFAWEAGVSPDGEPYDIIMKDIVEANHLALVKEGKGGPSACVLDGREVLVSKKKSGLFYAIRKRLGGVEDDIKGSFDAQLAYLTENRGKLSEEEIGQRVGRLQEDVDYFPESKSKEQLSAFVQDLTGINQESDENVKLATMLITKIHSRLDKSTTEQLALVLDEEDFKEDKKEKPEGEKKEEGKEEKPGEKKEAPLAQEEKPEEQPSTPSAMDEPHAGLDDTIFDKKESELTDQECEYLHQLLMEVVKDHVLRKKAETMPGGPVAPAPAVEAPAKPAEGVPGHESSELSAEEDAEKKDKPIEEKKEKQEGVEDSVDRAYAPMPLDRPSKVAPQGFDTDALFKKLKGVK